MARLTAKQIADWGVVRFYPLIEGHLNDVAKSAGALTVVGNGRLTRGGFQNTGAGYLNMDAAIDLRITSGSIIVLASFLKQTDSEIVYSPQGTSFPIFYNSVSLQINANTAAYTTLAGKKCLGFNFGDGIVGTYWVDGLYATTNGPASAMGLNTGAVRWLGNGATSCAATVKAIVFCNRVLTATEHAALYAQLALPWPTTTGTRVVVDLAARKDASLVLSPSMKPVGGKLVDQSGNGRDITFTTYPWMAPCSQHPYLGDRVGNGTTNAYWATPSGAQALGTTYTIELIISPYSASPFPQHHDASNYFSYSGGKWRHAVGGAAEINWDYTLTIGTPIHLALSRSGTSVTLYINGVSLGTKTLSANGAYTTSYGEYINTSRISFYNEVKSAGWVADQYAKLRALAWVADYAAIESVAAEGGVAGAYLSNTPLTFGNIGAGRFKVQSEILNGEVMKSAVCTVIGNLELATAQMRLTPTEAAYGSMTVPVYLATGSLGNLYLLDASGNGYLIQIRSSDSKIELFRHPSGGPDVSLGSFGGVPLNSWFELLVGRTATGAWTLSVQGTAGMTATDNTYTTCVKWLWSTLVGIKLGLSSASGRLRMRKGLFS